MTPSTRWSRVSGPSEIRFWTTRRPGPPGYLRSEQVKSTFFLIGKFARKRPQVCRQIVQEGHVVGNHCETHALWKGLAKIPSDAGLRDIAEGRTSIAGSTGVDRMELFRPPYGSGGEDPRVCGLIAQHHSCSVIWTIDTLDSMGAQLPKQIDRVLKSNRLNGAIVLIHDHSSTLLDLVKTIVPALKRRGFRFVTLPELIAAGEARVQAQELAGLITDFQDGKAVEAYRAALAAGKGQFRGLVAREALDLAYMIARVNPNAGRAGAALEEMVRQFPAPSRPGQGDRGSAASGGCPQSE
ncbi:MAG: polysaccharide deacetylase family protein [Candidatus Riflebacteria bacterium]|nr:polysaccharide deacetylase family protein [Candidatus Riflebacteria bacterium]